MPQTVGGAPVPTVQASSADSPIGRAKRRTSEIKPGPSARSGWLTRWFSEKFLRLEAIAVAEEAPSPSPPAKSFSDNSSEKPRAASCLKHPDQVGRRPPLPNTRVQFTMPPMIVVVNREDLCFSRADDLSSSSEEPARFDLAEFASLDDDDGLSEPNTSSAPS